MIKTINTPDSWRDVPIRKAQEIKGINKDNKDASLEVISILIDEDVEDIRSYSRQSLDKIVESLSWVSDLKESEPVKKLTVDGEEYGLVKFSDLSGGEWIDLDQYLEDSIGNLHKIIGLLYRPIILEYKNGGMVLEPYDTVSSEARAEIFRDKVMFGDVQGCVVFFCAIEANCIKTIQDYFLQEIIREETINYLNQRKKLRKQRIEKLKNGLGINSFIRLLKAISLKLK